MEEMEVKKRAFLQDEGITTPRRMTMASLAARKTLEWKRRGSLRFLDITEKSKEKKGHTNFWARDAFSRFERSTLYKKFIPKCNQGERSCRVILSREKNKGCLRNIRRRKEDQEWREEWKGNNRQEMHHKHEESKIKTPSQWTERENHVEYMLSIKSLLFEMQRMLMQIKSIRDAQEEETKLHFEVILHQLRECRSSSQTS